MDHFSALLSAGGLSLALFVAFLAVDTLIAERLRPERQQLSRDVTIFALSAAVMFLHFHSAEGIMLDQRGSVIAIATLFGGPLMGLFVTIEIACIRAAMGGIAVYAGVAGVIADFIACTAVARLTGARVLGRPVPFFSILATGVAAGVTEALSLLLVPPRDEAVGLLLKYGVDLFGVQVVATCMFGWLLTMQLERRAGRRAQSMIDLEELALSHGLVSSQVEFTLKFALDGRILDANQAYARRSGYSLEELSRMNLTSLKVMVPGDNVRDLFARIRAAGKTTYETRHRTRTGEIWPLEVTAVYDDVGDYVLAFVRDITERKEAERHLAEKSADLRQALEQTIDALASALVYRDLASEGHAHRVRDLAVRIGETLGLDRDRIEGLRLAATVQNVGQIQTPAEILNRPRALGPEEMDLIRLHPAAGHAILRDIHFPWPIADITLQHHENFDGSGYPSGLAGDEILLDARIIRVADSVAAMMAHRPFRRAHDRDYAVAELRRHAGGLYDPAVADACLRLLVDEHYDFPPTPKRAAP